MSVQNSTCNSFSAPVPSTGTPVLFAQFSCTQGCPATLTFTGKASTDETIVDNLLDTTKQYEIYVFTDGSQMPAEIIGASLLKSAKAGVKFHTPFQTPFQFTSEDSVFVELVET
jgi:hypothetical protein